MKKLVAIIMGSNSDYECLKNTESVLKDFGIEFHTEIVSAHRTPDKMVEFAKSSFAWGFKVIIAGAGGAAHLPGMVASLTTLPVIGVPIKSSQLDGLDSLLSINQMPAGVPVATMAIGDAGAINAGLFAVRLLANNDEMLVQKLNEYVQKQVEKVQNMELK